MTAAAIACFNSLTRALRRRQNLFGAARSASVLSEFGANVARGRKCVTHCPVSLTVRVNAHSQKARKSPDAWQHRCIQGYNC
ncbi:hypothetical protein KCP73_22645 [Salmonella enterica subsp. enterica]|nr:hypothetical protein KCP73_22645 [Salmonella enterica subsp. enterica]